MMAASAQALTGLKSNGFFIYGTAWKKDQTKPLVRKALSAGFRKFDTAAQPRHYQEELVGEAIREAIKEGSVRREDLYVSAGEESNRKRC
jgi:diketogulonate reductase-like aldo/keto reductase